MLKDRLAAKGELPRIEDFLERAAPADRECLLRKLLRVEVKLRKAAKLPCDAEDYRQRFTRNQAVVKALVDTAAFAESGDPFSTVVGQLPQDPFLEIPPGATFDADLPATIGRYQIQKVLYRSAFGVVYSARDTQPERLITLKVLRKDEVDEIQDRREREAVLQIFAEEARKAVQLDHPSIVRVYDALCDEHQVRIVHRDLKPQNILVDSGGQPHVADFGLSLHESAQREHAGELAGTFPYMSPEQVRREVHRLDGRSDLWSLGVILYELLTGRRPFTAARDELFDEILHRDPKPPRMIDPQVPAELSRICLACLEKRATDRYASATDLIDELRHWLAGKSEMVASVSTTSASQTASDATMPALIVPKGLRSYDAEDAGFFLQLLPGPHDCEGLPKCVRFWKTKLEHRDPDKTFSVGLMMYGPSGCGMSSLVKAALLPHLSGDVGPIYVEATAADTEVRLLKTLKKHCPELPTDASLPDLLSRLRDHGGSRGRKVVLVLDQFEQWLHAHAGRDDSQLIPALRQCDGASVQALVLVRDDFWMSATRFMQALEVPLVEGHNSGAVNLFDLEHAGKVLAMFGHGYGKLPAPPAEPAADQQDFLAQAVRDIAEGGKVVSVRLAAFAEMRKARPWTMPSLREVGGTTGVCAHFLEETFSAKTAAPSHRLHQQAACDVLKSLLPEQGTEIKGQMRSYDQLLDAADYHYRRSDFDALLRFLDSKVRLITPSEPDGEEKGEKLVMILIPPGEFVREGGGQQFRVRLTKPFYLGKYEVTQAQWQAVMGSDPSQNKDSRANPVKQVSWDDIQPFLAKLNAGGPAGPWRFELPTEAQWEYACRAGTTTAYTSGDSDADLPKYAWFNSNSEKEMHSVGQLQPNPFGLYDPQGNVWEWCVDWYEAGYYAKAPVDDPRGPSQGSRRVLLGGSWENDAARCRSAIRDAYVPAHRWYSLGFRLALSPPGVPPEAGSDNSK